MRANLKQSTTALMQNHPSSQFTCSSFDISTGAITCRPNFSSILDAPPNLPVSTHRRRENRSRRGDCEELFFETRIGLVSFASIADRKIAVQSFILYISPSMNHRHQLISSMIHSRDTWRCLFSNQRYLTFTPYSFYNLSQFASIQ